MFEEVGKTLEDLQRHLNQAIKPKKRAVTRVVKWG